MDIFTLVHTGSAWEIGETVTGFTDVKWVERYDEAGVFTLTGLPTNDILAALPLDTLISHTKTNEVMIVEDREITEDLNGEAKIEITGRSLIGFLDHRVSTDHKQGFNPGLDDGSAREYQITGNPEHTKASQIRNMIARQIQTANVPTPDLAVPNVIVTFANGMPNENLAPDKDWLTPKRESLLTAALSACKEERYGIKTERPYYYSGVPDDIRITIHQGEDRREEIIFSYDGNDLESAKYFESNQDNKNALYTASRYWGIYYQSPWYDVVEPFDLKVGQLNLSNINMNPSDYGWYAVLQSQYLTKIFKRRSMWHIRDREKPLLLEATISKSSKYRFRDDYNIGDIVTVNGNYGFGGPMRVIEYVESDDADGIGGYPVLEYYVDD